MAEIVVAMQQTDKRMRREENGQKKCPQYALHSPLRPRLALQDPTRGTRSRGCGKSLLVRDEGSQYPFCPSYSVFSVRSYPDLDPSRFARFRCR
jgi:hypothetical protein